MKSFLSDESGSAWAWLVVLVTIFTLIVVWGTLGPVVQEVHTFTNASVANTSTASNFLAPMAWMLNVWRWWPVLFLGGIILWAIAYSVYQEAGRWQG